MSTESPPAPSAKKNPLESFERFMRTVRSACATPGGRAALRSGLAEELSSPWQLYMHLLPAGGSRLTRPPARPNARICSWPACTPSTTPPTPVQRSRVRRLR